MKPDEIQAILNKTDGQVRLDQAQQLLAVSFATEASSTDFEQATSLWHVLGKQAGAQERFGRNAAAHLSAVTLIWLTEEFYGIRNLVREISSSTDSCHRSIRSGRSTALRADQESDGDED